MRYSVAGTRGTYWSIPLTAAHSASPRTGGIHGVHWNAARSAETSQIRRPRGAVAAGGELRDAPCAFRTVATGSRVSPDSLQLTATPQTLARPGALRSLRLRAIMLSSVRHIQSCRTHLHHAACHLIPHCAVPDLVLSSLRRTGPVLASFSGGGGGVSGGEE